jgi:hypothetical protein
MFDNKILFYCEVCGLRRWIIRPTAQEIIDTEMCECDED